MKTLRLIAAPLAAAVLTVGCATQPDQPYYGSSPSSSYPAQSPTYPAYPAQQPQAYYMGYVDRIEVVKQGDSHNIAGTVIGGIVGGLI